MRSSRRLRAAHSFFAAFVGWLIPFLAILARMQFSNGGTGYITDFEFLLYWPLAFAFLGWLAIALPVALVLGDERVRDLKLVVPVATVVTTTFYLVLAIILPYPASGLLPLAWWPFSIGAIGGTVFCLLQRRQSRPALVFWLTPVLFFPLIRYVVYPVGLEFFPYETHVLAEGAIGPEAELRVIEQVKVGDTYHDLHRRYPAIFDEPTLGLTSSTGLGKYSVSFDEDRAVVTSVSVERRSVDP